MAPKFFLLLPIVVSQGLKHPTFSQPMVDAIDKSAVAAIKFASLLLLNNTSSILYVFDCTARCKKSNICQLPLFLVGRCSRKSTFNSIVIAAPISNTNLQALPCICSVIKNLLLLVIGVIISIKDFAEIQQSLNSNMKSEVTILKSVFFPSNGKTFSSTYHLKVVKLLIDISKKLVFYTY